MIQSILRRLGSKTAFYTVLGWFVFEALWIGLTSRYPMAFDEQQHFGVIKLHASTWWPFFASVPDQASQFGAIARDPSFLYHYLMSFPYRLIEFFTASETLQIISLRLINIALVVGGLLLFRKLLLRLGLDGLRTNIAILFFSLIPIFPLMAGQITYDNLTFLLAAAVLLMGVVFVQRFRDEGRIDAGLFSWLLVICLFASMVKYAFLPVFAAVVLCLSVIVIRNWSGTVRAYKEWWRRLGWKSRALFVSGLLAGAVLFMGSYGYNVVVYHAIAPQCHTVLGIEPCKAYAPWHRNYVLSLANQGISWLDVLPYVKNRFRQMMSETFFVVSSRYDGTGTVVYDVVLSLPILLKTAWALFIIGVIGMLWNAKTLWRNQSYRLIMAALLIYGAALFGQNFIGYLRTGTPVAIHERYLLPIMLPVIGIAIMSVGALIRSTPHLGRIFTARVKAGLLTVCFVLCLQGGLISFISASKDTWFWPQNQEAQRVNGAVRSVLAPLLWRGGPQA